LEIKVPSSADEKSYTYYLSASTLSKVDSGTSGQDGGSQISLPFSTDKPLAQMSQNELLIVLIRLILYLKGITI
jgi:hypothetical protein